MQSGLSAKDFWTKNKQDFELIKQFLTEYGAFAKNPILGGSYALNLVLTRLGLHPIKSDDIDLFVKYESEDDFNDLMAFVYDHLEELQEIGHEVIWSSTTNSQEFLKVVEEGIEIYKRDENESKFFSFKVSIYGRHINLLMVPFDPLEWVGREHPLRLQQFAILNPMEDNCTMIIPMGELASVDNYIYENKLMREDVNEHSVAKERRCAQCRNKYYFKIKNWMRMP
jgi:hypothetical protein